MTDIVIDLETLGIEDSPVIIQISAIAFNILTGEEYSRFDEYVNVKSCIDNGLKIDGETVEWWFKQTPNVFLLSLESKNRIEDVLKRFSEWVSNFEKPNIWGNGILADNRWITQAYKKCSIKIPWKFYQDRDVRTLVELGRRKGCDIKTIEFQGVKHNAIDDCKHEMTYMVEIYKLLNQG